MTAKPCRIQLSRRKGFNLQAASIALNGLEVAKIARPSMFGNPFTIAEAVSFHAGFDVTNETPRQIAVRWFREWIGGNTALHPEEIAAPSAEQIARFLRGKNLACWCRLDQACHADVLLEIANA